MTTPTTAPTLPAPAVGSALPPVLDACCGSRMMWFNRADGRALFLDKRRETCHADTREGRREIVIDPDILADFTSLPFDDSTFSLVVFDPPHTFGGPNGWTTKKYGRLPADWRDQISRGFAECFRVLCPLGTLKRVRAWWNGVYQRLVNDMHVHPESEDEMNGRLGDCRNGWLKRADHATTA